MSKSHIYSEPDLKLEPRTDDQILAMSPMSPKAKQLLVTSKEKRMSVC